MVLIPPEQAGGGPDGHVSVSVSAPASSTLVRTIVALASVVLSPSVIVNAFGLTVPTIATGVTAGLSVNVTGPKSMPAVAPFKSTTGATLVTLIVTVAVLVPETLLNR